MISVVIPTYNRAEFISSAIESVLAQTHPVDEIIVVDDGSTDNTKEKVFQYPSVQYVYQENHGVASARNTGIELVNTEWVAFLDSDDLWGKNKIKTQLAYHQEHPNLMISHTDEEWFKDNHVINKPQKYEKFGGKIFDKCLEYTTIGTSTLMVNTGLFNTVGLYDERLVACEDYDFYLRVAKNYTFGYIDKKLTIKRAGHSGQLSFETKYMDYYRVLSLMKFKDDPKVAEVIKRKMEILRNGAIKHNNSVLLAKLDKLREI